MTGPAESGEAAVGIEKIVEPIEEAQAGIDEGRARAADQDETRWSKWIEDVAERERVQRLGRLLSRDRDRELRAFRQARPAYHGNACRGRRPASTVRRMCQLHIGEILPRVGGSQPDVHPSPRHDVAAPERL